MFRLLRRILLVITALVVVCITALVVIACAYEDEVKAKIIAELNTHLKVPVSQGGMDLSLLKRFPQASFGFHDVLIPEVRTDSIAPDTLLYAKDLYLEFSLISMLRGDYTISRVHGDDVSLRPGLDKYGAENWLIWKSDSTASGNSTFKLKSVTFAGMEARYRDDRSQLEISTRSEQLALRGHFKPEGSTLNIEGDVLLDHWKNAHGVQISDRKADVKLAMAFGGADGAFRITKGEVMTGSAPIEVKLAVTRVPNGQAIDLRANGFNLALRDVVALLPESLHKRLRNYGLSGDADVAIHFAGPLGGDGPALSAGMKVRDGKLKERASGTVFKAVRGELALELAPNGTPRKLVVKGFSAEAASGTIGGDMELNGLVNAKLEANVHGDIALADLLRFARIDTLEEALGRLKADAHVRGKLNDVARLKAADLRSLTINGTAELRDASLKLKGVRHRITALNAALALRGNDALINGLRCEVQGNPIELSGTLHNLMPYLMFPDQRLTIEAKGSSPRLDLAALISVDAVHSNDAPSSSKKSSYTIQLPAQIDLDLQASVDELVFEDFTAEHITGTIRLQNQVLSVSPLSFTSANGAMVGTLKLDGRSSGEYPLSINAEVKHVDITRLFHEFKNFGQTFITDHHLKGSGDVRLALTASLTPSFGLDQNSIHCIADVTIDKGELNDHAPMMAVADYVKKNKLIAPFVDTEELRKRLTHVTIAHLENRIEIKDRTVFVPQMTVSSSAMDIEVSGAQTFDGGVDDHLDFRLGDLFKTGDNTDEFGPIVDDGTGVRIFLHMSGTTSNLQFSNDGAMAAARRKEKMKQETAQLKTILSDVWHGNNTNASSTSTGDPKFSVDFGLLRENATATERGKDSTAAPLKDQARLTEHRKGLGRLLDKPNKDDEPQEKITVE